MFTTYAQSYSKNHQRLFSALQNQAGLSWIKNTTIGVRTDRRFMLNALSMHTAAIAIPTHSGTFAGVLQQMGFSEYHEQLFGLAYSHAMGEKCSAGVQFNYHHTTTAGYDGTSTFTADVGGLFQLTSQLMAGVHAENVMNAGMIPVIYTAGLGYEASDNFLLGTLLEQQDGFSPAVKVMCEYALIPQCIMELNWGSDPMQRSMSVAFLVNKLYIKVYAAHHPQLGFSPGTMLVWQV
jgi:hypothetical protein